MVTATLNAQVVELIFRDSRQKAGDSPDSLISTPCLRSEGTVAFHEERLRSHSSQIEVLLHQLPPRFLDGAGCPLSRGCDDRRGRFWGLEYNVEQLLLLGIAIGMVKCLCDDTHAPCYRVLEHSLA